MTTERSKGGERRRRMGQEVSKNSDLERKKRSRKKKKGKRGGL
jgi:hypothetical protein